MDDTAWMQHCLTLAAKGLGRTAPNPMVGAVIVRDGALLSEGWHEAPGTPHAEVHELPIQRLCLAADTVRVQPRIWTL